MMKVVQQCQCSHVAVGLLLKAFVGRHAQRHLANLAAETAFVPELERDERRKPVWS